MRCPKCNAQGYRLETVDTFQQYHCSFCGKISAIEIYKNPVKEPIERIEIQPDKVYTGLQATKALGMKYNWFYKAAKAGLLSSQTVKRGKRDYWFFRGSDLLNFRDGWSNDYQKMVEVQV